jgi:CubicO group peptidase (beta-lactamase class C family)
VSGQPLERYFREHIFERLGMADTGLVRSERVMARLATGYELCSDGAEPVADYEVVTVGAGGVYSTPRDMARYLAALLGGGAGEHGSVLEAVTHLFAPERASLVELLSSLDAGQWQAPTVCPLCGRVTGSAPAHHPETSSRPTAAGIRQGAFVGRGDGDGHAAQPTAKTKTTIVTSPRLDRLDGNRDEACPGSSAAASLTTRSMRPNYTVGKPRLMWLPVQGVADLAA